MPVLEQGLGAHGAPQLSDRRLETLSVQDDSCRLEEVDVAVFEQREPQMVGVIDPPGSAGHAWRVVCVDRRHHIDEGNERPCHNMMSGLQLSRDATSHGLEMSCK